MQPVVRLRSRWSACVAAGPLWLVLASCGGDSAVDGREATAALAIPNSHAMGLWTPHRQTDAPGELPPCTKALHDSYKVIGPDGKWYPTWHPPSVIDPKTRRSCAFGHEHGQDPASSALWSWMRSWYAWDRNRNGRIDNAELAQAGLPFGYVAEQLDGFCTANNIPPDVGQRHEDHVGHKVVVANQLQRSAAGPGGKQPVDLFCDTVANFHQGTHSPDAFRNSVHETKLFMHCNAGSLAQQYPLKMALSVMGVFGRAGGFLANDLPFPPLPEIVVGSPVPRNSPVSDFGLGSNLVGQRAIPTQQGTVQTRVLVPVGQFSGFLDEDWAVSVYLTHPDGRQLAYTSLGLETFEAPRIHDGLLADGLRRSIDMCYQGLLADGTLTDDPALAAQVVRRARGGTCEALAPQGPATPRAQRIAWDDPRSPFNGCNRNTYFGLNELANAGGPGEWYTDPYGRGASRSWFPGSVRQWLVSADIDGSNLPFPLEAEAVRLDPAFCSSGKVRAPN